MGLLGHGAGLYDDLTVAENIRFWARSARRRDAVDASLTRLGLDGRLASVGVGRLSAGQRRRAALAALLVRDARLWLLDEPHAGLDADGRDILDGLIAEAAADGVTVLIASHELERVGGLVSRAVEIAGGTARPVEVAGVA